MPFDHWTLIFYAAWSIAADDGGNPAQVSRLQTLFEARKKQMYDLQTSIPISINDGALEIPTRWTE